MVLKGPAARPLACLDSFSRCIKFLQSQVRFASAGYHRYRAAPPEPPRDDPWAPVPPRQKHRIRIAQTPSSIRKNCPEPLRTFNASQIALLDPSGARTRLFSENNEDAVCLGDVLLVRFKNGDPFFGVFMAIRRHGPDTSILLRNTVMRVGTEMRIKIYNPTVVGIEIVQRAERRARRARLHYLRKPEHDRGDLTSILNQYLKTRRTLGAKKRDKKEKLDALRAAKDRAMGDTIAKTANQPARSKGKAPGR